LYSIELVTSQGGRLTRFYDWYDSRTSRKQKHPNGSGDSETESEAVMKSKHNIAGAVALALLSLFPLLAFDFEPEAVEAGSAVVYDAIASWPVAPREVAVTLIDTYGPPNEISSGTLTWHRSEPWPHTLVYSVDSGSPNPTVIAESSIEKTAY
jgi:hypothetical protein